MLPQEALKTEVTSGMLAMVDDTAFESASDAPTNEPLRSITTPSQVT